MWTLLKSCCFFLTISLRLKTNFAYDFKSPFFHIEIITIPFSSALANNVILKVNNMDQMSNGSKPTRDLATPSQLSNEADSAWEGSDNQDFRNNSTQLFRHNSDLEPDFPPKPVSLWLTSQSSVIRIHIQFIGWVKYILRISTYLDKKCSHEYYICLHTILNIPSTLH